MLGQTSVIPPAAYYQPSPTAEYDEDSPGGDFDFFSNLVTKWETAARLPGESTRQVVVRSGENQGPGYQTGLECLPGLGEWQICGQAVDGRTGSPRESHTSELLQS